MIKTAHLFAGAGGGILADLILGHEPKIKYRCRSDQGRCAIHCRILLVTA